MDPDSREATDGRPDSNCSAYSTDDGGPEGSPDPSWREPGPTPDPPADGMGAVTLERATSSNTGLGSTPNAAAGLTPQPSWRPDVTFKILLVGDSGVGKTALLLRFINNRFEERLASTVGVDFAIKRLTLNGVNVKCTIWDTAGQERFRTLTQTFYRGAKGAIFVYDVCRPETLQSLQDSWMPELAANAPHMDIARMVVGNKIDQAGERGVTWEDGSDFARRHSCLFCETSAKQNVAVATAFEELCLKVLESPALLSRQDSRDEEAGGGLALGGRGAPGRGGGCAC